MHNFQGEAITSYAVDTYATKMPASGALSHHVRVWATLTQPCCEEAQTTRRDPYGAVGDRFRQALNSLRASLFINPNKIKNIYCLGLS